MQRCGLKYLAICFVVMNLINTIMCDSCVNPQVKSEVYTTTDAQMSMSTVVIIKFSLTCKGSPKDLNIYADFNGRTLPASRVVDTDMYQVSFTDEHAKLPSGQYQVRFFDEELYGDYRKAQRSGEGMQSVKSLFTVDVNHPGVAKGMWVQTEFMAASVSAVVFYLAYTARSRLQS